MIPSTVIVKHETFSGGLSTLCQSEVKALNGCVDRHEWLTDAACLNLTRDDHAKAESHKP
jgi:hypothetical protein